MNLRAFLIFSILFSLSAAAFGQYYETGQDPASLKWKQIKTERFRIIYPEDYGREGIDYARALDSAYLKLIALFPQKKFKIPVIIHSHTTHSNGYVSWAPRRMELYPTPEQNSIPLDTKDQLAIHELTHVLQMQSLNSGFTKFMSYAVGEQFTGVVASLLPLWFLEGDAVFAETILTGSGRGRSPSFQKHLKAIVAGNGAYKYDKMLNGSFRDFIPDHYQTGYQMVAWSYSKYDRQLWNNTLKFTANQPFTINPVNISLYNQANLTKKRLFIETFTGLETIWKNDLSQKDARSYETLSPPKKGRYINYHSPLIAGKDSVIAIKTSLSDPSSFVLLKPSTKTEERIHTPGYMNPWYLSYAKGKIVWVENRPDPRWENRNFSVIKIMDLKTRTTNQLTSGTRYLSAAISPNGAMIAAIENTPENKNHIVFIEPGKGTVIHSVPAPGNVYLQRPQWSSDGSKLSMIFLNGSGEGVMSFSSEPEKWQVLIEPGTDDIQSSFLRNDTLFYISSASGTDNLYFLTPEGVVSTVTDSEFGTGDFTVSGKNVLFTDYSVSGNNISTLSPDRKSYDTKTAARASSYLLENIDPVREPAAIEIDTNYNPVSYRKWQHLFNIHSWMPFYADLEQVQTDPASIRPGVTILSQNHLSTLTSTVGYEYSEDKRHKIHSKVTWKSWYPVIESQLDYGNEPVIDKLREPVPNPGNIRNGVRFINTISLPLVFSTGNFSQNVYTSVAADYRNSYVYLKQRQRYDYGQTQLTTRLYLSNISRSAHRDIYPRWGQIMDVNFTFSPFDNEINGTSKSIKTAYYFPGILPNSSLKLRAEGEKQKLVKYYIGNRIHWPRSYKNIFSQNLTFLSADYAMPLLYPDLNLAGVIYLKRIRGSVFYDYAHGKGNAYFKETNAGIVFDYSSNTGESFKSFGFELMSDFHVFRSPFLISAGVQSAWKDTNTPPVFEFLLNIDIFGMTIGR